MILVTDNFLDEETFSWIYSMVEPSADTDRLYFVPSRKVSDNGHSVGNIQFVHNVMTMSGVNILGRLGLQERLQPIAWVKAKFNFSLGESEANPAGWHNDVCADHVPIRTGILYLNTNNGYTEFEDGTKVESVANRYVEFNESTKHRGVNCTNTGWRCLLNINYVPSLDSPVYRSK